MTSCTERGRVHLRSGHVPPLSAFPCLLIVGVILKLAVYFYQSSETVGSLLNMTSQARQRNKPVEACRRQSYPLLKRATLIQAVYRQQSASLNAMLVRLTSALT